LGRQAQERSTPNRGQKRRIALSKSVRANPRNDACNAHPKHLSPAWGQRVGGVSGRPTKENEEERSSHVPLSRRWKASGFTGSAATFAGGRKSVGLGRFVIRARRDSSPSCGAPATKDVLWTKEEGNVVGVRQSVRTRLGSAPKTRLRSSRTRPSLGPETRARQSPLNSSWSKARRGGAVVSTSRSGKPGQPGGTGTGVGANGRMRGSPRVTALRATGGVVRDA
jgi:hypothetical protein